LENKAREGKLKERVRNKLNRSKKVGTHRLAEKSYDDGLMGGTNQGYFEIR